MALTDHDPQAVVTLTHPVLFAYDGSELAALAIEQAGLQCAAGRDGVVLCVWQPADVGFTPTNKRHFDADSAVEVGNAAEETAEFGASLATKAGFHARSLAFEGAPIWKGIIDAAVDHQASLIVMGTHRRSGIRGHLLGSVAAEVAAHARTPLLIVPPPA